VRTRIRHDGQAVRCGFGRRVRVRPIRSVFQGMSMLDLLTRFRRAKPGVVDSARPFRERRGAANVSETPDLGVQQFGGITVVEFLDRRIVDQDHVARLGRQLRAVVQQREVPNILLSFEKVEFLSSASLSELLSIEKLVRARGGKLRLANLDRNLKKMFSMTKLDKVLKICKNNDQAVKSFE
jgi:anti-sigma B factor antagonist